MTPGQTEELNRELLAQNDAREFIRQAIKIEKKYNPRFSYSLFCRRAGLKSRSYVNQILSGRKKLSLANAKHFIAGLKLSNHQARLFEQKFVLGGQEVHWLERARYELLTQDKLSYPEGRTIYEDFAFPFVYAAMGTPQQGANLKELTSRTGIKKEKLLKVLSAMRERKLIRYERSNRRYFPKEYQYQSIHAPAFQEFFLQSINNIGQNLKKNFERDDTLFFHSSFNVKKSQLPKIKEEIRKLLIKNIDQNEDPQGDQIVSLITCLDATALANN